MEMIGIIGTESVTIIQKVISMVLDLRIFGDARSFGPNKLLVN